MTDRERKVLTALKKGPQTVDRFVTRRKLYVNSWAPVFTKLLQDGFLRRTGKTVKTSHGAEAHELTLTARGRRLA